MAISGYQVNGPAIVVAKTSGSYSTVGYTDAGVNLSLRQYLADIFTDVFGPNVPQDVQDFGMTADIDAPFIALDRTVMLGLQNLGDKTTNTDGTFNSPGLVMMAGGYSTIIGITSQYDNPWYFKACFIRDDKWKTRLATKANPVSVRWLALPLTSYTTILGTNAILYSRASI